MFAKEMTDAELIEVVHAMDNAAKPLARRFKGDDEALVDLMVQLGFEKQTLVDKLLITGEILRECAARGIQIPRSN